MMNSRVRTRRARIGGRRVATLVGIATLAAACCALEPGTLLAGPSAVPARTSERRVFPSGVQADTLDYDWREVYPVAIGQLEKDGWAIQRADTASRCIVTRWKPIDHVLTRLAFGDVMARCAVDLSPLPGGRTVVRMRGGLASTDDLGANPVFGTALAAYRKAARKYMTQVRGTLERSSATAARAAL
jgi:hypothetical protein